MPSKKKPTPAAFGLGLLCFWSALLPSPTFSRDQFPTKYDAPITAAVTKWWPDVPYWRLLKSQLIAESRLDPDARSAVGAEGLAQFMSPTWQDAIRALGWPQGVSRRDAAYAIEGGAWYMRKLRTGWKPHDARTPLESHWLGVASYNRGTGNIIKDQAACDGALLWSGIEPCTAKQTIETVTYVRRIKQYWQTMEMR